MSLKLSDVLVIENKVVKSLIEVDIYGKTIGAELLKALDGAGDRNVLVDTVTKNTWTGIEAAAAVRKLASALVTDGVEKGQIVCFYTDDRYLGLNAIAFMAVLVAGATYTGGDFKYPFKEVLNLCERSSVDYLVVSESTLEISLQVAATLPNIKKIYLIEPPSTGSSAAHANLFQLPSSDQVELPVKTLPEDIAMVSFSSGTTGPPKTVMISSQAAVAYQLVGCEPFSFGGRPGERLLVPMPLYHMSDVSLMVMAILRGSQAVLHSHAAQTLLVAAEQKATSCLLVISEATYFAKAQVLLDLELSDVVVGGARVSKQIGQLFKETYKIANVRNGYGSTECGWLNMVPRFVENDDASCSGAPITGCQFKIVQPETGELLGPNEVGEVCVNSPQMFTRYKDNPEATSEAFDAYGFFRTGDGGYYDERGFLYITDRYKEVLKVDGIQVSPTELEGILVSHESVQEACVFGVPHPEWGEAAKAMVIKRPGFDHVSEQQLVDYVNGQVAHFKHLYGGLQFLAAFPRTPIGKIDRRTLKLKARSAV